jgi:hypothetical protein
MKCRSRARVYAKRENQVVLPLQLLALWAPCKRAERWRLRLRIFFLARGTRKEERFILNFNLKLADVIMKLAESRVQIGLGAPGC